VHRTTFMFAENIGTNVTKKYKVTEQ